VQLRAAPAPERAFSKSRRARFRAPQSGLRFAPGIDSASLRSHLALHETNVFFLNAPKLLDAVNSWTLHRHEQPHFVLVLNGGFEFNAVGSSNSLALGEAIFQEADVGHRGKVFTPTGHGFSVELTEDHNPRPRRGGIERFSRRTRISSLLTQIYRESRIQDSAQRFAVEGLVLLLLATLLREAEPSASQPPQWISRATQLLEECACENHTMDDLSRILGVDQNEISAAFRKYLQCTPAEYQRTQRLEVARRYLAESSYCIARIAAETGFCDQAYFCHQFKRAMNCTPSQYRALFQPRKLQTSTGDERIIRPPSGVYF
jgi:AraC family transcriptional regulator